MSPKAYTSSQLSASSTHVTFRLQGFLQKWAGKLQQRPIHVVTCTGSGADRMSQVWHCSAFQRWYLVPDVLEGDCWCQQSAPPPQLFWWDHRRLNLDPCLGSPQAVVPASDASSSQPPQIRCRDDSFLRDTGLAQGKLPLKSMPVTKELVQCKGHYERTHPKLYCASKIADVTALWQQHARSNTPDLHSIEVFMRARGIWDLFSTPDRRPFPWKGLEGTRHADFFSIGLLPQNRRSALTFLPSFLRILIGVTPSLPALRVPMPRYRGLGT